MATKVYVGSAGIDERGKATGGKAGNQNGRELKKQLWYLHSKGWRVFRAKDRQVALDIAKAMKRAIANKNIGYDQAQRNTLYSQAEKVGFDPGLVKTACETDCSALVRVCLAYAGITGVPASFRTGNMPSNLKKTDAFVEMTGKNYQTGSIMLGEGDILVTKTSGHTVVVLNDGDKFEPLKAYALGDRMLEKGAKGDDVKQLQLDLLALGYKLPKYGADGDFGSETLTAVKAFQRAQGLEVDGIVGSETLERLMFYLEGEERLPEEEIKAIEEAKPAIIPDVSQYQGTINMKSFCGGCSFAVFRARVNGKNDSKFKAWAKEMNDYGFKFAVYDFVVLKSVADAKKQAEAMFKLCDPFKPTIYYLDTEKRAKGISYAKEKTFIKAYVQRLRELGVKKIGQYTGDYRWRTNYKDIADIFDTLWIANWGANKGSYTGWAIKSDKYTDKIDLHQYTSMGYTKGQGAPGIKHRIDMNRLTGKKPLEWFKGEE